MLIRDKRVRLPLHQLEVLSPPRAEGSGKATRATTIVETTTTPEAKAVPGELNLIGCTVEEAIDRADKFLDDAVLSDRRHVRLIHGHGTGRLKKALSEWLAAHPHVAGLESDSGSRGGATVVELKG